MKNYLIIAVFILSLLYGCGKEKEVEKSKENAPSVVVFEQALGVMEFKNPFENISPDSKKKSGVISYVKEDSLVEYRAEKINDTLSLNNPNHYVEIRFECDFEDYSYCIAPNDTVQFSVDEYGIPTLKSKTSALLTELYNFPYEIQGGALFVCYRALTGLLNFGLLLELCDMKQHVAKRFQNIYVPIDTLQQSFLVYRDNYQKGLDSLKKIKEVPKEYIAYLTYRQNLDNYSFELSKYFCGREDIEKKELTSFFNDDYVIYPSYYKAITQDYLMKYFKKKEGVSVIKQSNGSEPDWRDFYDKIIKENYPVKTKNIMLKYLLQNMASLFSVKAIQFYLDDYVERTGDKAMVEAIVNPFDLTASEKELSSKSLLLKDMKGKVQTLEQILEVNKGYVLYVDFWASWCTPCRSLMPDSKKLHKKYADKKVKFLYFSIDSDEKAWEKAVLKDKLEENSYLIVNTEKPAFAEEINLGPIPRYLVFDKVGKLVVKEAPRPNQGKIETIFDKYLKE